MGSRFVASLQFDDAGDELLPTEVIELDRRVVLIRLGNRSKAVLFVNDSL